MLAISQLASGKELMGNTEMEKVRVLEWLNWLSGTLHGVGFGMAIRPERFCDDKASLEAIRRKGVQIVKDGFGRIEDTLADDNWAVGGAFTAVDAFLYVLYRWGVGDGIADMRKDYPRYTALVHKVVDLSATRKALQAEGVGDWVGVR